MRLLKVYPYIRLSLISGFGFFLLPFSAQYHDTYLLRHCCIASYRCYHPILSELRFHFVIDKSLIILTFSIQKMVGVNMNHFDAQAHVHPTFAT